MFKQIHKLPGKSFLLYAFLCSITFNRCVFPCVCSYIYVCVSMLCHTVLCLSTTVLRAYWGKPLPPHLHFPWELWHSDEIQRYLMAGAPLSLAFTNLQPSWALSNTLAVFNLYFRVLWRNHPAARCKVFERQICVSCHDASVVMSFNNAAGSCRLHDQARDKFWVQQISSTSSA